MIDIKNIGMPSLIELDNILEQVSLCKELGLGFIELNMNSPIFSTQSLQKLDLSRITKESDIYFTIHLPEEIDLASFNDEIREGFVNLVINTLNTINNDSAKLLNMHLNCGIYFTLPDRKVFLYEKHKQQFLRNFKSSLDKLLPIVQSKSIPICIENTGNFDRRYLQDALSLFLSFDHTGLTWDIGHDASADFRDSFFFEKNIQHILHIHLHDSDGTKNHNELFSGIVDIPYFLKLGEELGTIIVIETKTVNSLRNSVLTLKNRGLIR